MKMIRKKIEIRITGKYQETKRIIFKMPKYIITMATLDHQTPLEREVTLAQYSAVDVGDTGTVTMYSLNGSTWYFSRSEANGILQIGPVLFYHKDISPEYTFSATDKYTTDTKSKQISNLPIISPPLSDRSPLRSSTYKKSKWK